MLFGGRSLGKACHWQPVHRTLEGSLQTRKWQDKDGHDRYSTEVVLQGFNSQLALLDTRGGSGAADTSDSDFGDGGPSAVPGKSSDMDDEIPF